MYQRCLFILLCGAFLVGCGEDANAPRVIAQVPAPDSTAVPRRGSLANPLIKVQFNEKLRESSVPDDAIALKYNGEALPGLFSFVPVLNTAAFNPFELLFFLRKYDVSFDGRGISDLDGNSTQITLNWSFRVTDGVLRSDILIGNKAEGDAIEPQVAAGSNEHSHVIWTQYDGTRTDIWARALKGTQLKDALRVENSDAGDANSPQIVIDEEGHAIAVWSHFDGTNWRIQANRFTPASEEAEEEDEDAQGTWGTAAIISGAGSDATVPQIAIGPNGNAIAVWVQSDGRVYENHFSVSTGTWAGATTIDNNAGTPTAPQIVINDSNNAFVVWSQNNRIYGNRYTSGVWEAAPTIIDNGGGAATEPQIAADSNGNAIAVWSQSDGAVTNIWANRFDGAWTPSSAELIETTGGNANTPQIAMNQSGNAIAVWSHQVSSSTRFRIRGNHFTGSGPGSGWQPATELIDNFSTDVYSGNITAEGISTKPQVAIDGDGNALAIWSVKDGTTNDTRNHIAGNRYRGSGAPEDMRGWDSAQLIESETSYHSGDATSPQVAIAPDFTGITVWSKLNLDDRAIVHANLFN